MATLLSCLGREPTKICKEKHWKGVRGSSQVRKFWEIGLNHTHRLAARGLPPGANAETAGLCDC